MTGPIGDGVQRSGPEGHSPDVSLTEVAAAVSDRSLWLRATEHADGEAFAALYERHSRRVALFVSRRLSPAEAEDVTAEVFLAAWRQRDRIVVDAEAGLLPWLIAVARNQVMAAHRRAGRDQRLLGRVEAGAGEPDPADTVAEQDEAAILTAAARRALVSLSVDDQAVLELCLLGELTPTEASHVLGQPASTVRSRLTRARRRLAAAYDRMSTERGDRRG